MLRFDPLVIDQNTDSIEFYNESDKYLIVRLKQSSLIPYEPSPQIF